MEKQQMREKLVDLIIDAKRTDPETGSFTEYLADHLIANGVTFTEDINVPAKWVSVAERLPDKGVRVLTTDGAFVGEMYLNDKGQWRRYNVNNHELLMALDVLYWMPMPVPPKGE